MNDVRQTKGWAYFLKSKGWKVISVPARDGKHSMQAFIVPLGFLGLSILKLQRSDYDPDWEELRKIRKKYRVVSSIIEPTKIQDETGFSTAGYKISKFPYLPTKTNIIDLRQSKKTLWENLSENARRNILKNKNTTMEEVEVKKFLELWKKNGKVWTFSEKDLNALTEGYKGKMRLVVSRIDSVYHSGLLIIYTKDVASYCQTWTGKEGRASGAHYSLVWEEILRAKKNGLKYFDFEGIYDNRFPQKKWLGFSEFKRRFGGKEVIFPGSFTRWL